jgi:SAM-dependent methyltransferase
MKVPAARGVLEERKAVWASKEILRRLYRRWYDRIARWLLPGRILELGGGSGHLKQSFPEALSTDVVYEPWLDAVLDAHRLPFRAGSFSNVVLFDVLHHLSDMGLFFEEAQRVLQPGGRILLMEPCVSALSYPVYRFLHHEGLSMEADPLAARDASGKDPFEGNQALPGLLFDRHRSDFSRRFPRLRILCEEKTDFFVYPLSGGFHNPSLCPLFLYPFLRALEDLFTPLADCLAFRLFVVLEKQ